MFSNVGAEGLKLLIFMELGRMIQAEIAAPLAPHCQATAFHAWEPNELHACVPDKITAFSLGT